MLTVSRLARRCGLSRSTLLYYESIGLMKSSSRTSGNYRCYGDKDLRRLQQICAYREAGLALADIQAILDKPETDAAAVLKRRLVQLSAEIDVLRHHQRAIVALLQAPGGFRKGKDMTKDKWVSIMKAAGFSQADMSRWHSEFERSAPEDHEEFLRYLHIPEEEIRRIRELSLQ
jgi:MerR family transcriptional regulator, thiopeptide resistance regulator